MVENKNLQNDVILVAIITLSIFSILLFNSNLVPDILWANEPFHSSIESVGAMIAIFMALILFNRGKDEYDGKFIPIATGFLGMGIFDGLHAITTPGQDFVFLHSIAVFAGGFFFALILLPRTFRKRLENKKVLYVNLIIFILVGLWAFIFQESIPMMVVDEFFTPASLYINIIGGTLFILASIRFIFDFHKSNNNEIYLFSCLSLLFGFSGVTFNYSGLWDGGWWLWHMMRLAAYMIVVGVVFRTYQKTFSDLKIYNLKLEQSEKKIKSTLIELNQIFNTSGSAITVIDRDFNVLKVNEELIRIIGLKKEDISGKKCYDAFTSSLCKSPKCPLTKRLVSRLPCLGPALDWSPAELIDREASHGERSLKSSSGQDAHSAQGFAGHENRGKALPSNGFGRPTTSTTGPEKPGLTGITDYVTMMYVDST